MSKEPAQEYLDPQIKWDCADWCCFFLPNDFTLPMGEHHEQIFQILEDESVRRAGVAGARFFGKSIPASKGFPLYTICERDNPDDHTGIMPFSETADLAYHWVREVKRELESNKWILARYGDLRTKKWTEDHIICKRPDGRTIELKAKGAGGQARGFHPKIAILDDVEGLEAVRSEDRRANLREWFERDIVNMLGEEEGARLFMIGTVMHELSLLADVMERPGWVKYKFNAIKDDGPSLWESSALWPEKWPIEKLKRRYDEITLRAFMAEMMNSPQSSENPVFYRHWFKHYETGSAMFQEEIKKGLYTVVACDPAISKGERADYTAIVTVSATFDREPRFYVRKGGVTRGHWTINRQVTEIDKAYRELWAKQVVIEKVAYQEALVQEFHRFMEDNRQNVRIHPVNADKDKVRRAEAVASYVQRGQVYIDTTDPNQKNLLDECIMFPTGDRDDYVDALVYAMQVLIDWSKALQHEQTEPEIVLPGEGKYRSKYTGYA